MVRACGSVDGLSLYMMPDDATLVRRSSRVWLRRDVLLDSLSRVALSLGGGAGGVACGRCRCRTCGAGAGAGSWYGCAWKADDAGEQS